MVCLFDILIIVDYDLFDIVIAFLIFATEFIQICLLNLFFFLNLLLCASLISWLRFYRSKSKHFCLHSLELSTISSLLVFLKALDLAGLDSLGNGRSFIGGFHALLILLSAHN